MLNRKNSILASAILAALPVVGNAATINFQYSPGDIFVNGVLTPLGGTAAAPTLTVPQNAIIDIGAQVVVTNNPNPAFGDAYDTTAPHAGFQPVNLGLSAFGFGFNTSSSTVAAFDAQDDGSSSSGETINATEFKNAQGTGLLVGGNISQPSVSGGLTVASVSATTLAGGQSVGFGANGTPGELFSNLQIDAGAANGSATITPLNALASNAYAAYNSGGTTASAKPVYKSITTSAADVVNNLPVLTIIVGTVTTGVTHQAIISLTAATTPLTTYGAADGAIVVNRTGPGSYNATPATGFLTATTGFVPVSGFSPTTDTEVYALKLSTNGNNLSSGQVTTVANDINGTGGLTNASTGVFAQAIPTTGPYASLFPASQGYNLLLTATGVAQPAQLGFDFSSVGEQDASVPNITVTGVAAVPEPATAAGLVLGAAGLLLGRRKNRFAV